MRRSSGPTGQPLRHDDGRSAAATRVTVPWNTWLVAVVLVVALVVVVVVLVVGALVVVVAGASVVVVVVLAAGKARTAGELEQAVPTSVDRATTTHALGRPST